MAFFVASRSAMESVILSGSYPSCSSSRMGLCALVGAGSASTSNMASCAFAVTEAVSASKIGVCGAVVATSASCCGRDNDTKFYHRDSDHHLHRYYRTVNDDGVA